MRRAALVLATTASAAVASAAAPGTHPAPARVSPFGGSVAVHLAHVGHIDVALGPAEAAGLRQVRCDGPVSPAASCFVAR